MEKVKVNSKLFKEMELVLKNYGEDETGKNRALRDFVGYRVSKMGEELHSTSFLDFSRMLLFGYEIDKKEVIKNRIEEFKKSGDRFCEAYVDGIYDLLEAYEMELEGINKK